MEDFDKPRAQIVALATLAGVVAGMLREKGLFDRDDCAFAFERADSLLPNEAATYGAELLDAARTVAAQIKAGPL